MELNELKQEYRAKINEIVKFYLDGYTSSNSGDKIIHDTIWGTNKFYPWEIAILDSPLLQRLRYIKQTGLACYVYPNAEHSRYTHTLGVIVLTQKILETINSKDVEIIRESNKKEKISIAEFYQVRLAALLHDVGHGFLSHVSEDVYKHLNEFAKLKREWIVKEYRVTPKEHEIFSFLMVQSDEFKTFFKKEILEKKLLQLDGLNETEFLNQVAELIIGHSRDAHKQYLADIINGPLDADKLDYLARDAHFAGPTIVYDIERYLQTIDIFEIEGKRSLSIPIKGIVALEQIIISRLMLFSYIYHHQKVRVAEAMVKEFCFRLYYKLIKDEKVFKNNSKLLDITHPCDFLKYTDRDFLNYNVLGSFESPELQFIYDCIIKRKLPKRALIVSRPFIEGEIENVENSTNIGLQAFQEISDGAFKECFNLKKQIYDKTIEQAPREFSLEELYIDIPKLPEPTGKALMIPLDYEGRSLKSLDEFFPLDKWRVAYSQTKWRAHVYAFDGLLHAVNVASRKVLKENYDLELSEIIDNMVLTQKSPL